MCILLLLSRISHLTSLFFCTHFYTEQNPCHDNEFIKASYTFSYDVRRLDSLFGLMGGLMIGNRPAMLYATDSQYQLIVYFNNSICLLPYSSHHHPHSTFKYRKLNMCVAYVLRLWHRIIYEIPENEMKYFWSHFELFPSPFNLHFFSRSNRPLFNNSGWQRFHQNQNYSKPMCFVRNGVTI